MAHSHGKFREPDGKFPFQSVAEFAESAECRVQNAVGSIQRRHRHETEQLNVGKTERMLRRFPDRVIAGQSKFGFFAGNIHFQQKFLPFAVLFRCRVDSVQQFDRIDGMDVLGKSDRFFRFVCLKMSDQMPYGFRSAYGHFGFQFLNAVFTEFDLPGGESFKNIIGRKCFGDREQADRCGVASCVFCRFRDVCPDFGEFFLEFRHGQSSFGFLMVSSGSAIRTLVPAGMLSVSQTLPPTTEFSPIVILPRIVAPA